MKQMISYDVQVLMSINGHWEMEAPEVVKDYIHYANGTANWCWEDQMYFEEQLEISNPQYRLFVRRMTEYGYDQLNQTELGTFYIIQRGITENLVNIGLADIHEKVPKNSFHEMFTVSENELLRRQRRKELKDLNVRRKKRGPKGNAYHSAYQSNLVKLLPWLRSFPAIKNDKEALVLIGVLLILSGHDELRTPYELSQPHKERLNEDGKSEWVPITFTEYLYGRMKRVYYDSPISG